MCKTNLKSLNWHQIKLERFPPLGGNPEGKGGQSFPDICIPNQTTPTIMCRTGLQDFWIQNKGRIKQKYWKATMFDEVRGVLSRGNPDLIVLFQKDCQPWPFLNTFWCQDKKVFGVWGNAPWSTSFNDTPFRRIYRLIYVFQTKSPQQSCVGPA